MRLNVDEINSTGELIYALKSVAVSIDKHYDGEPDLSKLLYCAANYLNNLAERYETYFNRYTELYDIMCLEVMPYDEHE